MKQKPFFFILAGGIFIVTAIVLSLVIWFALSATDEEESDNLATAEISATATPLTESISPQTPEPVATESLDEASDAPSLDMAALATDLAAIEGVSNVRVLEVKPFQENWLVYLEIDTDQGFNIIDTAIAARKATLTYTGEQMIFNVVLWDRVTTATNYTWDGGSQSWLTTPVLNNPG